MPDSFGSEVVFLALPSKVFKQISDRPSYLHILACVDVTCKFELGLEASLEISMIKNECDLFLHLSYQPSRIELSYKCSITLVERLHIQQLQCFGVS